MITNGNTILGLAAATLGLLGLAVALFAMSETRRWRGRCVSLESSLASLRRELELAASINTKTGRRLRRIEQEYASVADRVDRFELRGSAQFFDQAIDSARRGVDPGKLVQQFGLSCGEAELVTRLHGRRKISGIAAAT
jgi:hypothetical protein